MSISRFFLFFFPALLLTSCTENQQAGLKKNITGPIPAAPVISLQRVAENITGPVTLAHAGDGSGRLFIVEQQGLIRIFKNGILLNEPFLDIRKKVMDLGMFYDERGLLGLAFHPQYKTNRRFFVYYSAPSDCKNCNHVSILAEYKGDPSNPDKALPDERVIMTVEQPESNHNGGHLAFGPDGFLYAGLGDGGGAGDRHGTTGNAQDTSNLLGKIIRIDVNNALPYAIPKDNPFAGKPGRDEIWAYGLRNPWKYSMDRTSGLLFCGDAGQNKWEEVNIIEKGKNYGWRIMEGNHCYEPAQNCRRTGLTMPVDEYDHSYGLCVIGGYVYRGKKIPSLYGKYVYGDWKGKLFFLEETAPGKWTRKPLLLRGAENEDIDTSINAFGEDEEGELYILTQKVIGPKNRSGRIFKIIS